MSLADVSTTKVQSRGTSLTLKHLANLHEINECMALELVKTQAIESDIEGIHD